MTEGEQTTGGRMEGHPSGAGFPAGRGVWQPVPQGGEFDAESTGHMPLPTLTEFGQHAHAEGEEPLAAPGRGVPPTSQQWQQQPDDAEEPAEPAPQDPESPAWDQDPAPGEPTGDTAEDHPPGPDPHLEHPLASYVLRVNGADRPVTDAWLGESLLYVLRERLGLAGAKDGCEQGECGACSVQVDGRLVAACLVPAATAAGCEVRTVEGLSADGEPSDVQRALAESGAVQCGYCVPGLAMAVHDLLAGNHNPTELQTRQALCGNLCRCTGYRGVLAAVREVIESRAAASEAPHGAHGAHAAHTSGDTGATVHIPHQAAHGAGNGNGFGNGGGTAQ